MNNQKIRPCGSGWAYCDGDCKDCDMTNMITTTSTHYEPYGKFIWDGVVMEVNNKNDKH